MNLGSNTALAANLGGSIALGGIYTGTSQTTFAGIAGLKENATDSNVAGYLAFYSRAAEAAPAENMRITSTGNVGIGTTGTSGIGASAKLEVNGGNMNLVSASGQPTLYVGSDGSNYFSHGYNVTGGYGILQAYHSNAVSAISLNPNGGNVGIGTTSPLTKLDVRGTGYVSMLNVNYGIGGDGNGIINGGTNLYLRPQSGALYNDTGATYLTGGNVGIGTTNPLNKLSVVGEIGIEAGYKIRSISGTNNDLNYIEPYDANGGMNFFTKFGVGAPTQGYFDFYTASSAAPVVRINSLGNVGIGTTTPAVKLDVYSDANIPGLNLFTVNNHDAAMTITNSGVGTYSSGLIVTVNNQASVNGRAFEVITNGVSRFKVRGDGNVGIGTTSPGTKLEVAGDVLFSGASRTFSLGTAGQAWSKLSFLSNQGVITGGAIGTYFQNNAGTVNNVTILDNGNVGIGTTNPTGKLTINGDVILGMAPGVGSFGAIKAYYSGDSGYGTAASIDFYRPIANFGDQGEIRFSTNPHAGLMQRMVIDMNGNVGIGTTAPLFALDVRGGSVINAASALSLSTKDFADDGHPRRNWNITREVSNYGDLQFRVSSAYNTDPSTAVMTFLNNGNVGIGTISPTQKLTVSGNAIFGSSTTSSGIYLGDTNRYVWARGTGLALGTNAADQLTITSAGLVGIGTTSPQVYLDVNGSARIGGGSNYPNPGLEGELVYVASAHAYEYYNGTVWTAFTGSGVSYTGTLWAQSGSNISYTSGFVGIGTSSPSNTLDVGGGTLVATSGGRVGIGTVGPLDKFQIHAATNENLLVRPGVNVFGTGTIGIDTLNDAGSALAPLGVRASTQTFMVTGNIVSMFLGATGNVGIGTTNPGQLLSLSSSNTIGTSVNIINTSTGGYNWNIFSAGSAGTVGSAGSLVFRDSNNGISRMVIKNDGNVGIGTTGPATLLNIAGDNAIFRFGVISEVEGGPFSIDVAASGSATVATKGTGYGRNLIIKAGDTDNTAGRSGGDLYLRPGAPTSPATAYGNVVIADNGGNVGIGTTGPDAALHIVKGATTDDVTTARQLKISSITNVGYNLTLGYYVRTGISYYGVIQALDNNNPAPLLINPTGGNVGIGTTNPLRRLSVNGDAGGIGAWNNDSYSGYKENFENVSVLDKISLLSIKEWQYKEEHLASDTSRHLSPFSEDFRGQFGLGQSDYSIQSLDVAGVALKGVQELNTKLNQFSASSTSQIEALASSFYITNSEGSAILSRSRDIGASQNREMALSADSIILDGNIIIPNGSLVVGGINLNSAIGSITDNQNLIVEQLTDNFVDESSSVSDKILKIKNNLEAFKEQLAGNDDEIKTLNDQMDAISEFLTISNGTFDLKKGILKAAGIEAGSVVAGAFAVKAVDEDTKTVGQAVIVPVTDIVDANLDGLDDATNSRDGETVIVKTKALKENFRIFVTPETETPMVWSVSERKNGESFTIKLAAPAVENIKLNWWLVEEK